MNYIPDIHFREIIDNMDQPVYISDPFSYEIFYVNNHLADLFGKDIIGKKCYKTLQNRESKCPFCTNDKLFGDEPVSPYIWEHFNEKTERWYHIIDYNIEWGNKRARFEIAMDITELKESNERFKTLYENVAGGTLIIDSEYHIVDVNERTCEITGYSRDELLGQLCDILCPKGSLSKRCPIWEKNMLQFRGMDTFIKCKDNKKKAIFKNAKRIKIDNEIYILENFQDISERTKMEQELQKSEAKFRSAFDKANFYKDLLAHDMGNILNNIGASIEMLEMQNATIFSRDDNKELHNIIKNQLIRASSLISNVRALSDFENSKIKIEPILLKTLIDDAKGHILSRFTTKDIEIDVNPSSDTYMILGGSLLLEAFENILINGNVHNMNENVKLSINISRTEENDKRYIKIEFKDNGIGIPKQKRDQIFSRATERNKYSQGMGIGLSLVKNIIESYGGSISVEERIEGDYSRGSNFIVLLEEA